MDSVAEGEAGHPKGGRRSTIRIVVYVVIINIAGRPIHFIINQVASPSFFNLKGREVLLFIFFYTTTNLSRFLPSAFIRSNTLEWETKEAPALTSLRR